MTVNNGAEVRAGHGWRRVEEQKMRVRIERGLTPHTHVASERPQWIIRRHCLVAKTLLAAAISWLGLWTDRPPVLKAINALPGIV
eukprot:scaffold9402_cov77-Cyclotella_meneghiniana.AAC.1